MNPEPSERRPPGVVGATIVIVAARDEAERIGATLDGLAESLPDAMLLVADDGSADRTAEICRAHGAEVVGGDRRCGKGGAVTAAARVAEERLAAGRGPGGSAKRRDGSGRAGADDEPIVLLCDADLGASSARLLPLLEAVAAGECDLAVASFRRRIGGGLGVARGFARWAIERLCGLSTDAPISGQRAMRVGVLSATLPFAPGFGMEVGMTVDAVRAGYRVREVELDLTHRATGLTPGGFLHRGRQLADIARASAARRRRTR